MNINVSEIPYRNLYNIFLSPVAPTPIAWVSTLSAAGQPLIGRMGGMQYTSTTNRIELTRPSVE